MVSNIMGYKSEGSMASLSKDRKPHLASLKDCTTLAKWLWIAVEYVFCDIYRISIPVYHYYRKLYNYQPNDCSGHAIMTYVITNTALCLSSPLLTDLSLSPTQPNPG